MDIRAAGYGHPIGVGGCHHQGGSQVIIFQFLNNDQLL